MRQRGRPPHPDILTPREWEVAALVSEGLTNAEIAKQLDITERTAKYHVSEILGKLGLESRDEIAAWSDDHGPARWARVVLAAGMAAAVACLALVALLAIGTARTDGDGSALQISPGDVLHYEMRDEQALTGRSRTSETWMLVGDGYNEEKARTFSYNSQGLLDQSSWSDANLGITSWNGHEFERPAYRSVFMWEDEATIGEDILRSGMRPGATPGPDEEPFQMVGHEEIAGVRVRVYEHVMPQEADPELPLPGDGWPVRRVFLSDEPFGIWFGSEHIYRDAAGQEYPAAEWTMTSFQVLSLAEVPAETFVFDR